MESKQRWFSRKEVCAIIGMEQRQFRDYVDKGLFPRGFRRGKQQMIWSDKDVDVIIWLEMHRHRLRPMKPKVP